MDRLLGRLLRAGVRRGLGGDWAWLVLAGAAFVLRRALRDVAQPVESLTIQPGEQVLITVRDANTPVAVPVSVAVDGPVSVEV
jgi:hypothetical protein